MTKYESQTNIKMREALRKMKQEGIYVEYLNSSDEEKRYLEHIIFTITTKGYMPA